MEELHVYTDICTEGLESFAVIANGQKLYVDLKQVVRNPCRLRVLFFSTPATFLQENQELFGKEVLDNNLGGILTQRENEIILRCNAINFSEKFTFNSDEARKSDLQCHVFEDNPINPNGIFDVVLIPQPVVTIIFQLSEKVVAGKKPAIQKHFDSYSYLGLLLTDVKRMNDIIEKKYGQREEMDLVFELANSDLVDELFDAGVLIITWGINPFSYPIYSCQSVKDIEPILGQPFNVLGKYKVQPDIHSLSIIPGYKLKNWSTSDPEIFPLIDLFGQGNQVTLQPYTLRDKNGQSVVPSFALYRSQETAPTSEPLLNINLLN